MGAELSSMKLDAGTRSYSVDVYSLVSGQRFLFDRTQTISQKSINSQHIQRNLVTPEYQADWTVTFDNSVTPCPRKYQCSSYSPEKDILFIAYGQGSKGQYLSDCWILDFSTMKWNKLAQNLLSPRAGSSCIFVQDKVFIFGGEHQGTYYTDLHSVDINTGEYKLVETTGISPEARSGCVISYWKNKLYIWGGFNSKILNNLYVLDMDTYKWTKIDIQFLGRAAPAYCTVDNNVWIYGSTRNQGLIKLDMETNKLEAIDSCGKTPPMDNQAAVMIRFEDYLVFFGGRCEPESYSLVYAFYIPKSQWFTLHVRPDSDTLTLADGIVNEDGQFLLPSEQGFSALYKEKDRTIYSIFGQYCKAPLPIYTLYLGNAISFLNHRNDMLEMFVFSS
ncbi:Kelch motif family protein [Trichomonas vaginalis G3]|uniref:Kelch motif family protein n=1 Tax=Trichomonas vaginalis (strain ATCC PRA-98 / G3) TaxID=412133 RepID=A2FXV1_TRIV3|nr:nitrile biosynthetic process [Trichomonas vaginalis G3]EAX90255.1 Kelch motif family protein [Trichomonas vaginalis G3]KAI5499857.1 nitrile biosynthetic process [Trichomonas vaginalis G3]|eukprot:XP_001303185.1 Kelch motif family protein [Trichomonas vaginalis G3]